MVFALIAAAFVMASAAYQYDYIYKGDKILYRGVLYLSAMWLGYWLITG